MTKPQDFAKPNDPGWIGVDLDATLAEYHGWKGATHIGEPIPLMVDRVKRWIFEGREVRIFTARAWMPELPDHTDPDCRKKMEHRASTVDATRAIRRWCLTHLGRVLPVTCVKDLRMIELYDDRAVQVEENTGRLIGHSRRGLGA